MNWNLGRIVLWELPKSLLGADIIKPQVFTYTHASPDPVHGWDSIHYRTAEDLPVLLSGSQVERHSVLPVRHLDSPHRVAHHRLASFPCARKIFTTWPGNEANHRHAG